MKQIAIFLAEGFEEIEAITVIDVLRRAKLNVQLVSISDNLNVVGAHNIKVIADLTFQSVDFSALSMLILPGGMPGAANLNRHGGLKSQLLEAVKEGNYVAAICAAPLVLGGLGLLNGKKAVCYPGFEDQLLGAKVLDTGFVSDRKVITGRGVGAALEFSLELVRLLEGEALADQLAKSMLVK